VQQRVKPPTTTASVSPTLDGLFARTAARHPDTLALCDPVNKSRLTGQAPLRLTYAQADRAVSALAAQFEAAGLPPGSVIAVQLPNTVEYALTLLAAWRAGLIVALLPQLWRHAELTDALNRVGARAIVGAGRIEIVDHAELAMNAAAEAFSIRHVFGFGINLPEGMTPLDPVIASGSDTVPVPVWDARKAAIVSFDVTADGLIAVPRSHVSVIAGGLAVFLESGLPQGARLMSTILPSSFGGLASSIITWLLSGGTLSLHHPFDPQALQTQISDEACDTLIAPAPAVQRLAESGELDGLPTLQHVVGLWRTPERVTSSADWPREHTAFTDIYLFGEAGLFGARRTENGVPAAVLFGPHGAPRSDAGSRIAGEIILTPHGTLGLRGPMVPVNAYRPARKSADPLTPGPTIDYVDTGYAARRDRQNGTIDITAPPAGIAAVGGYRFRWHDLDQWAKRLATGAMLTALPDQINGYRLAGRTSDNARAREALAELGLNPLMTEAFRDRKPAD
jgi:acyl-CoA synthetase (AMP-forming)/AMP-acid ligase II